MSDVTKDRPISELFAAFTEWMLANGHKDCSKVPQPWRGELKLSDDVLKLTFNCSGDAINDGTTDVPPYSLLIASTEFLAVAVVNPFGGLLGGFKEDALIEAFQTQGAA